MNKSAEKKELIALNIESLSDGLSRFYKDLDRLDSLTFEEYCTYAWFVTNLKNLINNIDYVLATIDVK